MVRRPAAEGSPSTNYSAALQSQSSFQQRDSLLSATKPLHHITLEEGFSTIIYLCKQRDSHLLFIVPLQQSTPATKRGIPHGQPHTSAAQYPGLQQRNSLLPFTSAAEHSSYQEKDSPLLATYLCSIGLWFVAEEFPFSSQHSTATIPAEGFYQQPLPHSTVREIITIFLPLQQSSSATSREIPFLYLPLQQCTPATNKWVPTWQPHTSAANIVPVSCRRSPFYYFSAHCSGFQQREILLIYYRYLSATHHFGYHQSNSLPLLLATSAAQHAGYQQRDSLLLSTLQHWLGYQQRNSLLLRSYLRITALTPQSHTACYFRLSTSLPLQHSSPTTSRYSTVRVYSLLLATDNSLPLPYCTSASSSFYLATSDAQVGQLPAEGFPFYASAAHHTGHKRMDSLLLATSLHMKHIILVTTYQHFAEGLPQKFYLRSTA